MDSKFWHAPGHCAGLVDLVNSEGFEWPAASWEDEKHYQLIRKLL